MPSWRLPTGPGPRGVAEFVRTHYAPEAQRAAYRKLLAGGQVFTPAGVNGTNPGQPPPTGFRGANAASPPARTAAVNHLAPREWTGSPGLTGPYRKEPRLDPTAWEWRMNPENGRYFARPRTELTGLDPQQQADIKAERAQAAAQGQRITSAYDQFAQQAEQNRAATTAGLTGLAGQVGAGYMQGDPTAATLGRTSQQTTSAAALPSLARLSDLPNVARSEGLTTLANFQAQTRKADSDLIAGYRSQNADVAKAAADAQFQRQQLAATYKIAMGEQATTQRGQDITATTANNKTLADLKKTQATLENQLQIARENNQTSRANAITRALSANKAKQKKAKTVSASDIRQWTKLAQGLFVTGVDTGQRDSNGQAVRQWYSPNEVFQQLVAAGAPKPRARAIVKALTGQQINIDPIDPGTSLPTLGW